MRVGVYSDSLPKLSRRDFFAWCAERGLRDVELGLGAWGPWPRPHLDVDAISQPGERKRLKNELAEYGIGLSAVNAAGNVLHPDPGKRADAQRRLDGAIALARDLGVDRVITMSGCPAGLGGGSLGVFPCWATSSDDENIFRWQMENEVGPFWQAISRRLAKETPGLMVCLELHPGVSVFSSKGFEELAQYTEDNIGINFDPSHFWWQGIDPTEVVKALGKRIGHVHGKDTLLYPDRIRRDGVLHFAPPSDPGAAPWHFASVGDGHDESAWRTLIQAVAEAGYDGVISIENEDPRYDGETATQRSLDFLVGLLATERTGG